jgi:hypothetical protein
MLAFCPSPHVRTRPSFTERRSRITDDAHPLIRQGSPNHSPRAGT